MKWSKEQLEAIQTTGKNLLVSASAGSGKTTVLIERIMAKLINGEASLDELLIVTFTEASAKEMKQRLRVKLLEKIRENPKQPNLRKQLMLLPNAHISTFHAFCNRVIKKYFYLIDADSKYQIAEEMELFLIKDEVIENLFLEKYEEQDERFLQLVDQFTKDRSDDALKQIILTLYDQLRNIPNREAFERTILSYYQQVTRINDFIFMNEIYQNIREDIERAHQYFKSAYRLASLPENDHHYQYTYELDKKIVEELLELCERKEYESLYSYIHNVKFDKFNSNASDDCSGETKEIIKKLRDKGRNTLISNQSSVKTKYFKYREQNQVKYIQENIVVIEALLELVGQFEEAFKQAKKDRGVVDFSDLEEMTLQIFCLDDGDNEAVKDYRTTFKEILIDEYQDTNSMQEAIIERIARPDNRFMVGDVKQSIYRFRHAEPEIFQEKFHSYPSGKDERNQLINLNANYRSRQEVIDFVNFLFVQIMDERIGEIDYDEVAMLKAGATYYPTINAPLIHLGIIDQGEVKERDDGEDMKKLEMEAHYVAQQIRQLIDEGELVYDKDLDEMRPIRYSDIVILSRSVKNEQPIFNDVFKEYQIPLLTSDLPGYFDSIEVLTITSFLEIIDNPLQDIPLVAVLRSPFYHIKERDLVKIHACAKEHQLKSDYFYEKLKHYITHGRDEHLVKALKQFLGDLTEYREFIKNEPLTELLYRLYHHTNYYDFVKGQRGGKQRQANLDLLFERAKKFEELTNNSLFKFVQLIKFLKEQNQDLEQARTVSENEDLVRFMSIHKSKGLEFPIVFIVNLNKKYNIKDQQQPVLFEKDLGIATSYYDRTYRVTYPSLYQQLIKDRMNRKMLAEEMRLLYVALTRAKERLYLVGSMKNPDPEIRSQMEIYFQEEALIDASLRHVNNYLDLIVMAMMRHPVFTDLYGLESYDFNSNLFQKVPEVRYDVVSELTFQPEVQEHDETMVETAGNWQPFEERLNFVYPQVARTIHFAKMSISDLKRLEPVSPQSYVVQPSQFKKPRFIDETNALTRGTVTHQFMQHIDYQKTYTRDDLEYIKEELIQKEILSRDDAEAIDLDAAYRYLQQPLVQTFKKATSIRKELPFTTLLDAQSVYPNYPFTDDVLVQGVMDLLVIFEDEVYLIDFKTDRISDEQGQIERVKTNYAKQMMYYSEAVKRLYPTKTVRAMLYLFAVDRFVPYDN